MQTSDFSAEFGRSSVVINTTLKSGSNKIHGTGFEFIQGSQLDANDFFNNLSGTPYLHLSSTILAGALAALWTFRICTKAPTKPFSSLTMKVFAHGKGRPTEVSSPVLAQLQGNLADDCAGYGLLSHGFKLLQCQSGSGKCVNVIDPTTGLPFANNLIPASLTPLCRSGRRFGWRPMWQRHPDKQCAHL